MLSLHTIKPSVGSSKKRKRVGRGDASGHGTYSGRGQKGQKSRSGGRKGLKRRGLKQLLLKTPKLRGFKSPYVKDIAVNVGDLYKYFKEGDIVSQSSLKKAGAVGTHSKAAVKILGNGELTVKNLSFAADVKISAGAAEKIKQADGQIQDK